jgi:hypothetical protein
LSGSQVFGEQGAVAVRVEVYADEEAAVGLSLFKALVAYGRAVEACAAAGELERDAELDAVADEVASADADGGQDEPEPAVAHVARVAGDAGRRGARPGVEQRDEGRQTHPVARRPTAVAHQLAQSRGDSA